MYLKTTLCFLAFSTLSFSMSLAQDDRYIDSLRIQLSAAKNVDDSIRAVCLLAWNIAESDPEETKELGELALMLSLRTDDSAGIADAYDAAALGYRWTGDKDRAKSLYNQALQIGVRKGLTERSAWSHYHLGSIAISENLNRAAEEHAQKAFELFHKCGNYNRAINSLFLIEKISDHYTDTLVAYVSHRIEENPEENDLLIYYLQLTNLYNKKEQRKQAMYYVQQAMELANKNKNNKGAVKAYYQIAEYFQNYQKDYPTAMVYYQKILEQEKGPELTGDLLLKIGTLHQLMGNDSLARSYFSRSLETGRKIQHRHTMASSFLKLGDLSYDKGYFDKALGYYLKCYKTGCDVCPQIKFHNALVHIGDVYLGKKDLQNALSYYRKSLALADSSNNDRARTLSYQALANWFVQQNDLGSGVNFYQKALQTARQANSLESQQYNALCLSEVYHRNGQYALAYKYLLSATQLQDSLRQIGEADNLARLETYFDYQNLRMQRELEQTLSKEEIDRQKLYRNFFIFGFVGALVIGFVVYRSYRRKKRDNLLLNEQKHSLAMMSEKVHEADQAKLQFYTNVSHELRTPLTLILGMTEKLRSSLHDNPQLELIRKNSYKLLHLINHLLDLRKLDASKMKLQVQAGNMHEFVRGVLGSFEEFARQKALTLQLSVGGEATGFFDHDKIEKVLSNLLSNAIKYTPSGGSVTVALEKNNNGFLQLDVSDNGIGIPEKEVKNIFHRFYRVSENDQTGSGIGLALVKELVELHKGEILVNTLKGEGTCLTVRIPVEKHFYNESEISDQKGSVSPWPYVEVLEAELSSVDERIPTRPHPDRPTLLIVEDNRDLCQFITEIFRDDFDVLEAENGMQGLQLASEYVPDLVISDILMPKLSGLQLVEKLKSTESTSHIPLILLTAKDDLGTRLSGFEKGADDYICKPFESIVLRSRVENLLRLRKHLAEKFTRRFHLQPRQIIIDDAEQKFLQKTIDLIETHIADPGLNIDMLAMELGVSRTQLYRKLKALTDFSANQFIRNIRLKRAAQILQQGQNNIAEVMDATGFGNYSYFNNCFREYFGEYPKDYALISTKGNLN